LEETKRLSVDGVHDEIHSFMKEHSVDSEKIFRMIDWNKTGNISYDEFEEWVKKISARKFTKDTLNNYYKGFKQPLNLNNFVIRVSKEFAQEEKPNEQPIVAGINMINEFLKINSTQMKKKSIEDYLVGKNVV
jgi:Ca2+-binding EF-hand superfamily protein